jgi:hypothetical protein
MCLMTIVFRNVKNTGTSRLEPENRACTCCTVWCCTYYTVHSISQTAFPIAKTELRNYRGSEEIKTILQLFLLIIKFARLPNCRVRQQKKKIGPWVIIR